MDKDFLIEILFYLGYAVASLSTVTVIFILVWLIFFRILKIKRIKKVIFKLVAKGVIEDMSTSQYEYFQKDLFDLRRKKVNETTN